MAVGVNLDEAFESFDELWSPRIVASVNDYDVKIARVADEFVWHEHVDTDEFFLVTAGRLRIQLGDGDEVALEAGEVFVVPRGMRHRPIADAGTRILMFDPRGTVNRGDGAVDGTAGTPLD